MFNPVPTKTPQDFSTELQLVTPSNPHHVQVQDLAVPHTVLLEILVSSFLHSVQVHLDGWCIRHTSQFWVICRLVALPLVAWLWCVLLVQLC